MSDTPLETGLRNDRNLHTYGTYARARVNVHMGEPFLSFLNRWNQMILGLTGESVPPLPALPGHEIVTAPFQAVPHAGTFGPPVRFRE